MSEDGGVFASVARLTPEECERADKLFLWTGAADDSEFLRLTEDGRCLARAADGHWVEVALATSEMERIVAAAAVDVDHGGLGSVCRVLCQLLTEHLELRRLPEDG